MGRNKVTQKEFDRRIKIRFPSESFTIIEYYSLGRSLKIQCNKCKKIIEVNKANNFLVPSKAFGCVTCNGLYKKRKQIMEEIEKRYEIIETKRQETHIYYTIKCKNCGHIRKNTISQFKKHLECGCVTKVFRNRTPEEFINTVNKNSKDIFSLVSEYKGQSSKVKLRHERCGFIFEKCSNDIINKGCLCPKCEKFSSRGEKLILNYLLEKNVDFIKEYKIPTGQRFDFYLENDCNKVAIEYNGEQHYKEIKYFGKNTLRHRQELDAKKQQYCKDNNIKLYIFPYTMTNQQIFKNLDEIINKFNDYPKMEQS